MNKATRKKKSVWRADWPVWLRKCHRQIKAPRSRRLSLCSSEDECCSAGWGTWALRGQWTALSQLLATRDQRQRLHGKFVWFTTSYRWERNKGVLGSCSKLSPKHENFPQAPRWKVEVSGLDLTAAVLLQTGSLEVSHFCSRVNSHGGEKIWTPRLCLKTPSQRHCLGFVCVQNS